MALKQIVPPVVWNGARSVRNRIRAELDIVDPLFGGEEAVFKEALYAARDYVEYGIGASTLWVDRHTPAKIRAVDTSLEWVQSIVPSLQRDIHRVHHVDLGPLGKWGMPLTYAQRGRFIEYVEAPWRTTSAADVVLIDGRFRVACFLQSLLSAPTGCTIIFDDYVERPGYHVIEEILKPKRTLSRQAHFVVPDMRDRPRITALRDQFLIVRE
ncbi:MAG: hypothetical protein AAGL89_13625 [Pseudomonadota bacterium]